MTPAQAAEAARVLVEARRSHGRLKALPDAIKPASLDEAYAVQAAFRELWPEQPSGWKIGATATPVQARFGLKEPFFGPFFPATAFASPTRVSAKSFQHVVLETEMAFRFAASLAPGGKPLPREAILAAIDALLPAFEIVSPRYDRIPFDSPYEAIADCGLNGAMVLGTPVPANRWRSIDLAAYSVRLLVNGVTTGEGTGADVLGHPYNVLEWSVHALHARGITIEAGQIISTGTMTGVVPLTPGQTAVGDFGHLGRVELAVE